MTLMQLKEAPEAMEEILESSILPVEQEGQDAEELRLLALEIIMYDPDLAKQLIRSGLQKVLKESPSDAG